MGRQTVEVARESSVGVDGLCAHSNITLLEEQIRILHPRFCAVLDPAAAKALKARTADTSTKVLSGLEGLTRMIEESEADIAFNSIMGRAGLEPTLTAIEKGMDVALANKETLVCAGTIVMQAARDKGVRILPVDSEHSAIFQCLFSGKREEVANIYLTASGGPFFGRRRAALTGVTKEQALAHPTWKMGQKISIDSATMMNKGFEVIEACHLFGVSADQVQVLVHRQSIVHSMVEFTDGCVIAQLGLPDMRSCIRYALTYPNRGTCPGPRLDLTAVGGVTFEKPDEQTFTLLPLARWAFAQGGLLPCVLNGANEAAVDLFLHEQIGFVQIFDIVERVVREYPNVQNPGLNDIVRADIQSRKLVRKVLQA